MDRIFNCEPSDKVENDWLVELESIGDKPIAKEVNLRKDWWKIGDQEKTGSCVGWAVADSCLRWHLVEKKLLTEEAPLSVRFVWMSSKEIDELRLRPTSFLDTASTKIKAGLDVIKDYGCVIDDLLPFDQNKPFENKDEVRFYKIASNFKIKNYESLILENEDKIITWKKWLSNDNGPIIVRLVIDRTWNEISPTNYILNKYLIKTAVGGGHAAAIVGYNEKGFIIRNSFGEKWGDKGFAYASDDYACKAFSEAYGITI